MIFAWGMAGFLVTLTVSGALVWVGRTTARVRKQEDLVKIRTEALAQTNEVMVRELKLAQKIQSALIPHRFPTRGPLEAAGCYLPMEDLGGDFYDVFETAPGVWTLVMADVSGHGVPAALVTAMVKVSLGLHSQPGVPSGQVLAEVNRELWGAIGDIHRYVTMVHCVLDLEAGTLSYSNAGHNDFLVVRHDGSIETHGPNSGVVGVHADELFLTQTIPFGPGDGVVLYTDGLVEALGEDRKAFTLERLVALVQAHHTAGSIGLVDQIEGEIRAFTGDRPPRDDIAFLAVRRPQGRVSFPEYPRGRALVPEDILTKAEALYQAREFHGLVDWAVTMVTASTDGRDVSRLLHWKAMGLVQLGLPGEALAAWDLSLEFDPDYHRARRNRDLLSRNLKELVHGS